MIYKPSARLTDVFNASKISCDCAIDVGACRMPSLDLAVDNILFPTLDVIVTTFYLMYPLVSDKDRGAQIRRKYARGRHRGKSAKV